MLSYVISDQAETDLSFFYSRMMSISKPESSDLVEEFYQKRNVLKIANQGTSHVMINRWSHELKVFIKY